MKKIISIISIFVVLCTLTGCNRVAQFIDVLNWEIKVKQIANEQAEIILNCLKTGDAEKLEKQFCENISSTHDLKAELAEAIEFIDGNIVDDGNLHNTSYSEEAISDGKIDKLTTAPSITHIKTDTGKEYQITFGSCLVNKDKPENVGMTFITIKNNNDSTKKENDVIMVGGNKY